MSEFDDKNDVDRAIDFSLGLLSPEEEQALLSEARSNPELEALLMRQCAAREIARSTADSGSKQRFSSRYRSAAVGPRSRIAIAASALAAAVALVMVLLPGPQPELYWLPIDTALSVQRSSSSTNAEIWAEALILYASHDLGASIGELRSIDAQGAILDLRNIYLASALLNHGERSEALRVLSAVDLESLPHPWRFHGREIERRCRD